MIGFHLFIITNVFRLIANPCKRNDFIWPKLLSFQKCISYNGNGKFVNLFHGDSMDTTIQGCFGEIFFGGEGNFYQDSLPPFF